MHFSPAELADPERAIKRLMLAAQDMRQLAAKLGFVVRGQGRGRSGEPMTVHELRRDVWQRRGG